MRSGHPYDRHVGRYGPELAAGLIQLAQLAPGMRVLDVGCGTGQLTAALAGVVGGERVAAIDPSADSIAVCRERAPDADVRTGTVESLPWADRAFDAVFAQLVVNLVDDAPAAVGEMARVARPGAPVVACVWDEDRMPLLRSYWDAVRDVAPAAVADLNPQAQVGVGDPAALREWWTAAGLGGVDTGELEVSAGYDDFEDLWFSFEAGVGYSGRVYTSLGPAQRASVRRNARDRINPPSGSFRLHAVAWTVRGTA